MTDPKFEGETKPLLSPFNTTFLLDGKPVQPEPQTHIIEGSRQPIYIATVQADTGDKLLMWRWTEKKWVEIEELPTLD